MPSQKISESADDILDLTKEVKTEEKNGANCERQVGDAVGFRTLLDKAVVRKYITENVDEFCVCNVTVLVLIEVIEDDAKLLFCEEDTQLGHELFELQLLQDSILVAIKALKDTKTAWSIGKFKFQRVVKGEHNYDSHFL